LRSNIKKKSHLITTTSAPSQHLSMPGSSVSTNVPQTFFFWEEHKRDSQH